MTAPVLGYGDSEMIQKVSDFRVLSLRMKALGRPLLLLETLTTRKQRISTGIKDSRGQQLEVRITRHEICELTSPRYQGQGWEV